MNTLEVVANIWSKHFGQTRLSEDADFFALGGDSIDAMRIIAEVQSTFHIKLNQNILFLHQKLGDFAQHITAVAHKNPLRLSNFEQDANCYNIEPRSAPKKESGPLSFGQQRLWILLSTLNDNPAYNILRALKIEGHLDSKILEQAAGEISDEHPALRTCITATTNESSEFAIQKINPQSIKIKFKDLTEGINPEQSYHEISKQEFQRSFELSKGPLVSLTLLQLSKTKFIFLACFSHIIADGWSVDLFFKEICLRYNHLKNGDKINLKKRVQYIDFAQWQRKHLNTNLLEKQLQYWSKQLEGCNHTLELPIDYPRSSAFSFRGNTHRLQLSPETSKSIKKYIQAEEVTLFVFFLSALHGLLHYYSGEDKIVVGTPIANRHYHNVEETMGFFVNTIPTIATFSRAPTFSSLLNQLKQQLLESQENQDLPFEIMVDKLNVNRVPGYHPIFQVMAIQRDFGTKVDFCGLKTEFLPADNKTSKFDITLWIENTEQEIELAFEYCTDLFAPKTIEFMTQHFELLLTRASKNPNLGWQTLLLPEGLSRFSYGPIMMSNKISPHNIHDHFIVKALEIPQSTALIYNDKPYTYEQLHHRAKSIAQFILTQYKVAVESIIALICDRSFDSISTLLGIGMAGCAYLPIDPSFSEQRIEDLLSDANIEFVCTQKKYADKLKHFKGNRWFVEDYSTHLTESYNFNNQINTKTIAQLSNLLNVLYTSGSTGRPKAVLTEHRNTLNRLYWGWQQFPFISPDEVCCQKTSLGFVDSVVEIFSPLLQGIPQVIFNDDEVKDPKRFVERIAHYKITRITVVPSYLEALLETGEMKKLTSLQQVIVSGEKLTIELARRFQKEGPSSAILVNLYGSSEVAGDVTYHTVVEADLSSDFIPIGKPIANTGIVILNHCGYAMPTGFTGEIGVIGENVARGYLQCHNAEDAKFQVIHYISHPFLAAHDLQQDENHNLTQYQPPKECVLYKTGDYGRYLPDGNIEFLGRKDKQVKLRGLRINLTEIEVNLDKHERVAKSRILLKNEQSLPHLIAFVLLKDNNIKTKALFDNEMEKILLQYIGLQLPVYMLPARILFLSEWPLSYNGKINENELIKWYDIQQKAIQQQNVQKKQCMQQEYQILKSSETSDPLEAGSPPNKINEHLLTVWKELFKLQDISVTCDFLQLGGNSLLAAKLISRIQSHLKISIPLHVIFDCPTPHELSNYILENIKETAI